EGSRGRGPEGSSKPDVELSVPLEPWDPWTLEPSPQPPEATMVTRMIALALFCLTTGIAMAQPPAKVTELMTKDVPGSPGKELMMIVVEHAPGGSNPAHRHNAQAMVYMLEGSVVMQVKGGPEVTLTPGQSFYEGPDDIHLVDRNASKTEPAK